MMLSRRGFFQGLIACAAASTCMPALEKCLAAVEPMVARASVMGGAYLDMASANAMLKEWYSPEKIENLAYSESPLLGFGR